MKIKIVILLVLVSVIFSGCGLLSTKNTYIQILNCEHGSIDVQLTAEHGNGSDYLLIAYPENGYCLKYENLFIYNDHPSDLADYYAAYSMTDYGRIIPIGTHNENVYMLQVDKESRIIINALFTKIE